LGVIAEEAVRITADTKGFESQVRSGVLGATKRVAITAGAAFAAHKIFDFGKEAVKAAAENETAMTRVGFSVDKAGESWKKLKGPVEDSIAALAVGSGMMKTDISESFSKLERVTGNHTRALGLEKDAMNLTAQSGKPLSAVTMALVKTYQGSSTGLTRLGIILPKVTEAQDALKKKHDDLIAAGGKLTKAQQIAYKQALDNAKAQDKQATSTQNLDYVHTKFAGAYQKQADTMAGQLKRFGEAWNEVKITVGELIIPLLIAVMVPLVKAILQLVAVIKEHGPEIHAVFDEIKTAVQAILTPVLNVAKEIEKWADRIGLLDAMKTSLLLVGAAVGVVVGAVKAWEIAQAALTVVMDASPIGLVILAIYAMVVGVTLLYTKSQTAHQIIDAAFGGIKAVVADAMGYITKTIIPAAITAWERFGPAITNALGTAVNTVKTIVQAIATVVRTVIEQIRAHWDQIWSVFGPIVRTQLEIVKTYVQTAVNVIADVIRLFSDLLHGRWGAAWGELKNIVRDVLNGVVGIVKAVLTGMIDTTEALARLIGEAIWNGIKAGASALGGLAGMLKDKVENAVTGAADAAYGFAATIGGKIKDGAINGITGLAGAIKDKAEKEIKDGLSSLNPFSPVEHGGKIHIGIPIVKGAVQGVTLTMPELSHALVTELGKIGDDAASATKKQEPKVEKSFADWGKKAKAAFDAQVGDIKNRVNAAFTSAQAALDRWKAKLTPTETIIAAQKAAAAVAKVQADVTAAQVALDALPGKQANAWAKILAQQAANIAALRATLQSTTDDALLSGNRFNRGLAAAASDPLAVGLVNAQKAFDSTKALFDQGQATQDQLFAASNALDDAKIAAAEDANATTLLDQYNTWQAALAQQASAGAAVNAQLVADNESNQATQAGFDAETLTAQQTLNDAKQAKDDFYQEKKAEKERIAHDATFERLSNALKKQHDRLILGLDNQQHAWDLHYDSLKTKATETGGAIGDNLATALRNSLPTVASAAAAIAGVIAQHLKVKSPTEKGPMSDLDTWWDRLTPTLLSGFDASGVQAKLSEAVTPDPAAFARGLGSVPVANAPSQFSMARVEALLERIEKHTQATATKPDPEWQTHVTAGVGIDASTYRARR
jgi:phage-related protein